MSSATLCYLGDRWEPHSLSIFNTSGIKIYSKKMIFGIMQPRMKELFTTPTNETKRMSDEEAKKENAKGPAR